MKFKLNRTLLLILCIVQLVLAAGTFALLLEVDGIVNDLLYQYGLIFDLEWSIPYQNFTKAMFGFLGASAGIGALTVGYMVLSSDMIPARRRIPSRLRQKETASEKWPAAQKPTPEKQPVTVQEPPTEVIRPPTQRGLGGTTYRFKTRPPEPEVQDDGVEVVAAIPMVCNKCNKVFTQPLCMFDFKSGKPRLVNVCPYCNAILAATGDPLTRD